MLSLKQQDDLRSVMQELTAENETLTTMNTALTKQNRRLTAMVKGQMPERVVEIVSAMMFLSTNGAPAKPCLVDELARLMKIDFVKVQDGPAKG